MFFLTFITSYLRQLKNIYFIEVLLIYKAVLVSSRFGCSPYAAAGHLPAPGHPEGRKVSGALTPDGPLSTNHSTSLNDLSAQDHINFGRSRASHQKYLLIRSLLLHPVTSLFESLIILQTNTFNILLGSP